MLCKVHIFDFHARVHADTTAISKSYASFHAYLPSFFLEVSHICGKPSVCVFPFALLRCRHHEEWIPRAPPLASDWRISLWYIQNTRKLACSVSQWDCLKTNLRFVKIYDLLKIVTLPELHSMHACYCQIPNIYWEDVRIIKRINIAIMSNTFSIINSMTDDMYARSISTRSLSKLDYSW